MLEMTNELVEAINHDDTGVFVQAARKQMAGETLRRDAVRLVVQGPYDDRRSDAHQQPV